MVRPTRGSRPPAQAPHVGDYLGGGFDFPQARRFSFALELERAGVAESKVRLDELSGFLRDEHGPGGGACFHPLGDVDRIPDGCVFHSGVRADIAHNDGSSVETHPHVDRDIGERSAVTAGGVTDLQGGQHCPARVVLVHERGTEQRQHAIAEKLVDRALIAVHGGNPVLEEPVENVDHVFGV